MFVSTLKRSLIAVVKTETYSQGTKFGLLCIIPFQYEAPLSLLGLGSIRSFFSIQNCQIPLHQCVGCHRKYYHFRRSWSLERALLIYMENCTDAFAVPAGIKGMIHRLDRVDLEDGLSVPTSAPAAALFHVRADSWRAKRRQQRQ